MPKIYSNRRIAGVAPYICVYSLLDRTGEKMAETPNSINHPAFMEIQKMKELNYTLNPKTNGLQYVPNQKKKSDTERSEAASAAIAKLDDIAEILEDFTDDFHARIAYNKLFSAYNDLSIIAKKD